MLFVIDDSTLVAGVPMCTTGTLGFSGDAMARTAS